MATGTHLHWSVCWCTPSTNPDCANHPPPSCQLPNMAVSVLSYFNISCRSTTIPIFLIQFGLVFCHLSMLKWLHEDHRALEPQAEAREKQVMGKGRRKVEPHQPALGWSPTVMAGHLQLLERPWGSKDAVFSLPFLREYFTSFSNKKPPTFYWHLKHRYLNAFDLTYWSNMANCAPQNPIYLSTNLYQTHKGNKNLLLHGLIQCTVFFIFYLKNSYFVV